MLRRDLAAGSAFCLLRHTWSQSCEHRLYITVRLDATLGTDLLLAGCRIKVRLDATLGTDLLLAGCRIKVRLDATLGTVVLAGCRIKVRLDAILGIDLVLASCQITVRLDAPPGSVQPRHRSTSSLASEVGRTMVPSLFNDPTSYEVAPHH
jgi:hypothetical protein